MASFAQYLCYIVAEWFKGVGCDFVTTNTLFSVILCLLSVRRPPTTLGIKSIRLLGGRDNTHFKQLMEDDSLRTRHRVATTA